MNPILISLSGKLEVNARLLSQFMRIFLPHAKFCDFNVHCMAQFVLYIYCRYETIKLENSLLSESIKPSCVHVLPSVLFAWVGHLIYHNSFNVLLKVGIGDDFSTTCYHVLVTWNSLHIRLIVRLITFNNCWRGTSDQLL